MRKASRERNKRLRAEGPDKIDIAVGENMRNLRIAQNMTLADLADHVGVKFQQVQKYESAANRISASRLVKIAQMLGVKVSVLFGEHNGDRSKAVEMLKDAEVTKMIRLYMMLDKGQKAHIRKTMNMMVKNGD